MVVYSVVEVVVEVVLEVVVDGVVEVVVFTFTARLYKLINSVSTSRYIPSLTLSLYFQNHACPAHIRYRTRGCSKLLSKLLFGEAASRIASPPGTWLLGACLSPDDVWQKFFQPYPTHFKWSDSIYRLTPDLARRCFPFWICSRESHWARRGASRFCGFFCYPHFAWHAWRLQLLSSNMHAFICFVYKCRNKTMCSSIQQMTCANHSGSFLGHVSSKRLESQAFLVKCGSSWLQVVPHLPNAELVVKSEKT